MKLNKIFRKHIALYENVSFGDYSLESDAMNQILHGYLEAALWTEQENLENDFNSMYGDNEQEGEQEDEDILYEDISDFGVNLEISIDNIETNSKILAYNDIKEFIKNAGKNAILEAIEINGESKLGNDIWFTRNGHGAGFFDHNYEHEEELINAGKKLGEIHLFITDNLTIAFDRD